MVAAASKKRAKAMANGARANGTGRHSGSGGTTYVRDCSVVAAARRNGTVVAVRT